MPTVIKDLQTTGILSLVQKTLSIVSVIGTAVFSIMTVKYNGTASGVNVDAILTFYLHTASLTGEVGSLSIGQSIRADSLLLFAALGLLFLIGSIGLLFTKVNQRLLYSGILNALAVVFIGILVLNFLAANGLNGQTMAGTSVKLTTSFGIGFYLVLLSFLMTFLSSFTKFRSKTAVS